MARRPTGQVIPRDGKKGTTYALRFRAYGQRQYMTLGGSWEGWTEARAAEELANVLADVRRGIWQPPQPAATPEEPREEPDFHVFASEWLARRKAEGLSERTVEDYEWALSYHLLPFFRSHRLAEITTREVDRYKTTKASEGVLSANSTNKTLTRLSQVLADAADYGLIAANPATGKKRRLKGTRPRRPWVEPEQLPILLEAAAGFLRPRGRPLVATLAGAGLRIDECLSLCRRDVNIAKGTLTVGRAKTEAGIRVIDLTPALRDELAVYLDRSVSPAPDALVFPTKSGRKDTRQNVRRRLLIPAIEQANKKLAGLGIEEIGKVSPHGLRRTYASLRAAAGDDPAYTAEQLGHEDPTFTLRVYTGAAKRRKRLVGAEAAEFDRALTWAQWARMGTNELIEVPSAQAAEPAEVADSA